MCCAKRKLYVTCPRFLSNLTIASNTPRKRAKWHPYSLSVWSLDEALVPASLWNVPGICICSACLPTWQQLLILLPPSARRAPHATAFPQAAAHLSACSVTRIALREAPPPREKPGGGAGHRSAGPPSSSRATRGLLDSYHQFKMFPRLPSWRVCRSWHLTRNRCNAARRG